MSKIISSLEEKRVTFKNNNLSLFLWFIQVDQLLIINSFRNINDMKVIIISFVSLYSNNHKYYNP